VKVHFWMLFSKLNKSRRQHMMRDGHQASNN
jgi:hypothetical protein